MKIEIILDRRQSISPAVQEALYQALLERLSECYPDISLRIAVGSAMALNVSRATSDDKAAAIELVQSVWEDADSWMPEAELA